MFLNTLPDWITRTIVGLCLIVPFFSILLYAPPVVAAGMFLLIAAYIIRYELYPLRTYDFLGVYWCVGFGTLLLMLTSFYQQLFVAQICCLVMIHDTCAYLGGSIFGCHALAPLISPKKTWEGVFFGFIGVLGTIALFIAYGHYQPFFEYLRPFWYSALLDAFLISFRATSGDLYISAFKRRVGLKDTGTLLPGHGGLLDRFDSLYSVIVIVAYAWFIAQIRAFFGLS